MSTSAYIQRYYNELAVPDGHKPEKKLGDTYVQPKDAIKTGLANVLKVQEFAFAEPTGEVIDRINATLQRIEEEVEQLTDITGASTAPGRAQQEQSGYAREFDQLSQRISLKDYGLTLTEALEDAYQLVNLYRGLPAESISVSGLDDFEIDDLKTLLTNLTE